MAFISSRIWLTSFVPTWWSSQTNSVVIGIGFIAAMDSIVSGKLKLFISQVKVTCIELCAFWDTLSFHFILVKIEHVFCTPFTQLLPTRVCFTNAGINNNNI